MKNDLKLNFMDYILRGIAISIGAPIWLTLIIISLPFWLIGKLASRWFDYGENENSDPHIPKFME